MGFYEIEPLEFARKLATLEEFEIKNLKELFAELVWAQGKVAEITGKIEYALTPESLRFPTKAQDSDA